ncbi:uncharacterized protein LOC143449455 isoform X2 [Clavelina lepadiformis]|uniref:uncharacterized protein LOC143449455 isoform X2 n=1 Tax=Clavelina lepadiformis TaxID=159417 RepID=UPI004040ED83
MPADKSTSQKAGSLKDPDTAKLFFTEDPDKLFDDLREIGHGSFGAVYYARNVKNNESVAVKKMSYSGKQSSEKWQDIVKEVKFLTQIKHPNIVEYKGCFLKEHTAWLAMEYCIGSASDLVEVHKIPLEEGEISGIIHEAMEGLHYLHCHNKIHRDIKAGNILLTDQGLVKLADFGSASIASPANSFVGTPYWMAPEVILAMDEGQYDGKADIWSMGITSVELAERKPPLFNMNAMSALYHIAQNDPPILNDPEIEEGTARRSWSQDFRDFVACLLQKVPDDRPTSTEVLQHPFMTKPRSPTVVLELIERTKNAVRDLDNLQYRKMKKILIAENRQRNSNRQASAANTDAGQMEEDGESLDDSSRTNSIGSIQSTPSIVSMASSSKSNSICSLNDSRMSDASSINSQEGASSGVSDVGVTMTAPQQPQQSSHTPSSASTSQYQTNRTASPSSNNMLKPERTPSSQSVTSLHQHQPAAVGASSKPGAKNKSQKDRFATIRSAHVIHRQLEDHHEDNRHREQLLGYKRMRQQHQKQLINYEQKLKNEMDEYSFKLIKELENLRNQFNQELERLIKRHHQELDKDAKVSQNDDRKFQKHLTQQQDHEIKDFLNQQKKDFKSRKEQFKEDSNSFKGNKEMKSDWLNKQISSFTSIQGRAEEELRERHQQNFELECRKHRRRALLARHNLEQDLLREELNMKQRHKEKEHETLLYQHDSTQALEYKQLHAIQEQRMDHLKSQHQTELSNQTEYSQRRENELKRKHMAAVRQQPKSLKVSCQLDTQAVGASCVLEKTHQSDEGLLMHDIDVANNICTLSDIDDGIGVSVGDVLVMIPQMNVDNLMQLCHIICNLLDVMDVLLALGFYDELVDVDVLVDVNGNVQLNLVPNQSELSLVDVTEDDLLQLAAETEQDELEKEDLIEGLRTLRCGSQEEVVISLKSKFMEDDDKKVIVEESEDDDLQSGIEPQSHSAKEDELMLPPEKSRTCPASSFAALLKPSSAPVRKVSDGDIDKKSSPIKQRKTLSREQSGPKKSKSLSDIVEHDKKLKTRKSVGVLKTSSNYAKLAKAPWRPSGIAPNITPKPEKFFTSASKTTTSESPKRGLRERVLTRATEINKKDDEKEPTKPNRRSRGMSKSIQEKAKLYSDEIKFGTVYSRPSPTNSDTKRPPWRYGKTMSPVVPLPTIKPFLMRKTTRKYEVGLNRDEMKDLKSGLSKVLEHSHRSCATPPARFGSLASSPLGRVSSSASRAAAATYASSNEPQTEYHGCEVCRLKEAMRNSPMSHRLKSAPHRCSSLKTMTVKASDKKSEEFLAKKKQKSVDKPDIGESNENAIETFENDEFSSIVVPLAGLSTLIFCFLLSVVVICRYPIDVSFLFVTTAVILIRLIGHCVHLNNPNFLQSFKKKFGQTPLSKRPLLVMREAKFMWNTLHAVYWKDALHYIVDTIPNNVHGLHKIFQCLSDDLEIVLHLAFQRFSVINSLASNISNRIPPHHRHYYFTAAVLLLGLLVMMYPAYSFYTCLTVIFIPAIFNYLLRLTTR